LPAGPRAATAAVAADDWRCEKLPAEPGGASVQCDSRFRLAADPHAAGPAAPHVNPPRLLTPSAGYALYLAEVPEADAVFVNDVEIGVTGLEGGGAVHEFATGYRRAYPIPDSALHAGENRITLYAWCGGGRCSPSPAMVTSLRQAWRWQWE